MWVCYSPRFPQETEPDEIPRGRPEVPPAPLPEGSTTFCPWRRALPAWSHTGCVCSFQETALSPARSSMPALHCAAHPNDSSTLPWRLLSRFHLGAVRNNARNTFFGPLKKQFCSWSQTSRMTKTNFTRALSLYLILYVCVCPPVCTLAGTYASLLGVHQQHITGSQHTHAVQSRHDGKQAAGL